MKRFGSVGHTSCVCVSLNMGIHPGSGKMHVTPKRYDSRYSLTLLDLLTPTACGDVASHSQTQRTSYQKRFSPNNGLRLAYQLNFPAARSSMRWTIRSQAEASRSCEIHGEYANCHRRPITSKQEHTHTSGLQWNRQSHLIGSCISLP